MGCGFQTGTAVSILWSDWTTTSTWSYVVTLIGMFLAGVLVELLRRLNTWAHRRYMVSSTEYAKWTVGAKLGAKLIRSSLHLAHVTVGYLVMLIVMSYNLGLFCAVMAGFGVGYFVLAENCTAPAKQFVVGTRKKGCDGGDSLVVQQEEEEYTPLLDSTGCH